MKLHESVHRAVVAISPHTGTFTYYADATDDAIGRFVRRAWAASPKTIRDFNLQMAIRDRNAAVVGREEMKAEWMKIFPPQVIQSYTSSVTFMKQLTAIAISTIAYCKQLFPEESYRTENFGDLALRILKTKCEDESAQFVSTSLKQSFDAIEKKYLSKLVLCLYESSFHTDNLVEAHSFEFSYTGGGVNLDVRSTGRGGARGASSPTPAPPTLEHVRETTIDLLRNCVHVSMASRKHYQAPFDISLRLYYNETTPAGYQAPGFRAVEGAEAAEYRCPLLAALAALDVEPLGAVTTPFHRLTAGAYMRASAASHEANASPNAPVMTQYDDDDQFDSEELSYTDRTAAPRASREAREVSNAATPVSAVPAHASGTGQASGGHQSAGLSPTPGPSPTSGPPRAARPTVQCTCGNFAAHDDTPLIICDYCGTAQHAVCYGVAGAAPARHACTRCTDARPALAPTCRRIAALPPKRRESMCVFRRVVQWAARAGAVSGRALERRFQLPRSVALKLLATLRSHGALPAAAADYDTPQEINRNVMKSALKEYFRSSEDSLVDQLEEESLSQEEPDPVGSVLGPEQQVSLQNATAIGKIVHHTAPDSAVEDTVLRQYKEALFSTNSHPEEELPLSGSHNPIKDIGKIGEHKATKRRVQKPNDKQQKFRLSTKKRKVFT